MKIHSSANDGGGLSDRIRLARRDAGLSQTALAAQAEVTPSAVAQWEHSARTQPALSHLLRIAEVTGVGVEWLLTGKGSRKKRASATPAEHSAIRLDAYAHTLQEESLLVRFRELSVRRRALLIALADELVSRKRSVRTKRR